MLNGGNRGRRTLFALRLVRVIGRCPLYKEVSDLRMIAPLERPSLQVFNSVYLHVLGFTGNREL